MAIDRRYAGYLYDLSEDPQATTILDKLSRGIGFTAAANVSDWEKDDPEICLVSSDRRHIRFAVLGDRGANAVTGTSRITFKEVVDLGQRPLQDLTGQMYIDLKEHFIRPYIGSGFRLALSVWTNILSRLKHVDSAAGARLEALDERRQRWHSAKDLSAPEITIAQEKDAVCLALEISGIGRKDGTLDYLPKETTAPSLRLS